MALPLVQLPLGINIPVGLRRTMYRAFLLVAVVCSFSRLVIANDGVHVSVEDLATALVEFYATVGQPEKAPSKEHAKGLLEMPKWKGKEMKMFKSLQKKYADENADAVSNLEKAFQNFIATETEQLQANLAQMRLQKEVLEGMHKINTVVRTLQSIGITADGVFDDIQQSAEEGNRLLDSINNEELWEEKLKLVAQGLSKRPKWIEQLMMVKDALSVAEEEAGKAKAVKTAEGETSEAHEMDDPKVMERTAKVMIKAVREGKPDIVAKLMGALEKKPEVLAKLIMWADEKTGANLLHWCSFYGKEVHVALTQTFMMVPGVNASVSDQHKHTPCHIACKKNHSDVLEHLITQRTGSSSTTCDPFALESGSNCLHVAAQGGFTQILQLLAPRLTADMLELVTVPSGVTARSLAEESGSTEAIAILDQAAKRIRPGKVSEEL